MVLEQNASQALQYGETEGYKPLREMIARHTSRYGIKAQAENVLITTGSQQALDLIGKLLINSGDQVLVETPTYLGALQAFNAYGAEYLSVPCDENGLRIDLLEAPLRSGPKFMYVLPNFQNPGGTTLAEDSRHALVLIANKYPIPIVGDDPYGQLRYEGEHLSPLVVLAPEVIAKLVQLKQGADLHTYTFAQIVAYEVARENFLDEHVRRLRIVYRERRDPFSPRMAKARRAAGTFG